MPRFKFAGAMALMMAVSAFQARGAAPKLPPDVVSADTVAVVHLDAAHFNPDGIEASATAILGEKAAKVDEPLKKFKEKYEKMAKLGVVAMTLVMDNPQAAEGKAARPRLGPGAGGIAYVELKPGSDVKAVEKVITEDRETATQNPRLNRPPVFEEAGNFLAMHDKDQVFPVKPDAARAALFATALSSVSEASIQIAIVPDDMMRDQILKGADTAPKSMQDALPLLAKSKWMTVAATMGEKPNLAISIKAASDADAKTITVGMNAGMDEAKQDLANPGQNAGPMAMVGPLIGPLLEDLRPVQSGSTITMTMKTESLKSVGNTVLMFSALFRQPPAPRGGPQQ